MFGCHTLCLQGENHTIQLEGVVVGNKRELADRQTNWSEITVSSLFIIC